MKRRRPRNIIEGNFSLRDPNPTEESQRGMVWGKVIGAIYRSKRWARWSRDKHVAEQGMVVHETQLETRIHVWEDRDGDPHLSASHFWHLKRS